MRAETSGCPAKPPKETTTDHPHINCNGSPKTVFSSARSESLPNSGLTANLKRSDLKASMTDSAKQQTYMSGVGPPRPFSPTPPRPHIEHTDISTLLKPIPTRQIPKHQKECSLLEGSSDWQHPMVEEYYTFRLNQRLHKRQMEGQSSVNLQPQYKTYFDQNETAARVAIWGSDATTCWGWVEKAGHARMVQ